MTRRKPWILVDGSFEMTGLRHRLPLQTKDGSRSNLSKRETAVTHSRETILICHQNPRMSRNRCQKRQRLQKARKSARMILEKKRDKTSMFTTVLYRIGLKDFDAILVPVNFFTALALTSFSAELEKPLFIRSACTNS